MDFGCYGANLATWLMEGEEPLTVTAVTQQFKPETYPKVEDEATIVVLEVVIAMVQSQHRVHVGLRGREVR